MLSAHPGGDSAAVLHIPSFWLRDALGALGESRSGSLAGSSLGLGAPRKAADTGDTVCPVHSGEQDTASATHKAPGPNLLPARRLCTHGRKGYGLRPILIKTTGNLLFSKE